MDDALHIQIRTAVPLAYSIGFVRHVLDVHYLFAAVVDNRKAR